MAAEILPILDFHSATSAPLPSQPAYGRVMVGDTLDLSVATAAAGSHTWPDPVWTALQPSVATVVANTSEPRRATVTGVAAGVALIKVSVAGVEQVYSVDVVPAAPTRVDVVVAG